MALFLTIALSKANAAVIKATDPQQTEIMSYVRNGLAARNEAIGIQRRMDSMKSDPEAWERLSWEEEAKRKTAAAAFDLAIKKTLEYYAITPAGLQFGESSAARQGPMTGAAISWEPKILDADHLSFQYTDADHKTRYEGAKANNLAGQTYGNGRVSINIQMFEQSIKYDHPGSLAYILHHEAQHFEEKVSRQEKSLQESEIAAYKASLDAADIFELGTKGRNASSTEILPTNTDWKSAFTQARGVFSIALQLGEGRSVYMTPMEETEAKDMFAIDQKELDRIKTETAALKEAAAISRSERQEHERQSRIGRDEKERRENERRQIAANYRQEMKNEAAVCGYEFIIRSRETDAVMGIKGLQQGHYFASDGILPFGSTDLRIVLLLTRTCDAIRGNYKQDACNDSTPSIRERAGENSLKAQLDHILGAPTDNIDGETRACVDFFVSNAASISDGRSFDRVIVKYRKHLEERKRDNDKRWGSSPKTPPARNGGESRPPTNDDQNYVWDPGCQCMIRRQ